MPIQKLERTPLDGLPAIIRAHADVTAIHESYSRRRRGLVPRIVPRNRPPRDECRRSLRARPEVDGARIGLWGGSYGGYMTALGLSRNSVLFAAGVDLHGVHDW